MVVRSIEDAANSSVAIDKWISSIADLHAAKPPLQVTYRHNYPDTETLMQVWQEPLEEAFSCTPLPSSDVDVTLPEYAKLLCSLLDIPTYDDPIESVHVMLALYMEFMNNPYFQGQGDSQYQPPNQYGDADVMEIEQFDTGARK